MGNTLQLTGCSFREVYQSFLPLIYRIAFTYLKNPSDSEDAAQETFLRLLRQNKSFQSREHCKAWLIVTAGNVCKDILRRKRCSEIPLDSCAELPAAAPAERELIDAVLDLPERYRMAVLLFYYEGYSVKETADLLKQQPETVKTWL